MVSTSMVTLKAQCHCGFASFSCTLPDSAFPLKSALCHCRSCRRATGHLFGTSAVIPLPSPPSVTHLTEYKSSSSLSRYFCPRCGASAINVDDGEWEFATGMLEKTGGLLNRVQLFVEDTRDGGAAAWLAAAVPEMHLGHRPSQTVTELRVEAMREESQMMITRTGDRLSARCHCGDVSFNISSGQEKYPAGLDACTSCRKVSGFEITAWATVPKESISMTSGAALDLSSSTLATYNTSSDVVRYFCKRCGATIFYLRDGSRTIDVGVGLLQAPSGARAEEFLTWEKYDDCVAYQEDAADSAFVQALVRGIQSSRNTRT